MAEHLDERARSTARAPRRALAAVLVGALALALVLTGLWLLRGLPADGGEASGNAPGGADGRWLSGASGPAAADGSLATWRGDPVQIVGTWADDPESMVKLWTLRDDGQLADWDGPVDIGIGAIGEGETWAKAAAGAYDERWRESLTNLATLREGRGQTYLRFAHEMNGDWYPWSVDADSVDDFKAAWARFRDLQREIMPDADLVFSVNRETVGAGMDWRDMFPGPDQVDLLSVDYYNQHPVVTTAEQWQASLDDVDEWGAPKGLAAHLAFARSVGLPLAISEWSANAEDGDHPVFFEQMHAFLREHGGTGPGQVAYEILFNLEHDRMDAVLDPDTRMPEAAQAYRRLW